MIDRKRTIRVLLVEDDLDCARLYGRVLALSPAAAFEVVHAPDLKTALGLVEREPFDALLLDLALPDGGSLSTLAAAAALSRHLPITILTGNDDDELVQLAGRIGAQDYLVKSEQDGRTLARALLGAIERHRWLRHPPADGRAPLKAGAGAVDGRTGEAS